MPSDLEEKHIHDICRRLISDIQALETRAMNAGMYVTGRALNAAKNKLGYEYAKEIAAARTKRRASLRKARAALGEQP